LFEPRGPFDLAWLGTSIGHLAEPQNPLWIREASLFVLLLLVWWRGIGLASRPIDNRELGLRFRLSSLLLAPLVVGLSSRLATGAVAPFILLFFLASLMAIALTRVEQLERDKTGYAYAMSPRWFVVVLAAAVAITLAAAVAGGLLSGQSLGGLLGWLAPLWLALSIAATGALASGSYLVLPLFSVLSYLLTWLFSIIGPGLQQALARWQEIVLNMPTPEATPTLEGPAAGVNPETRQWLTLLIMLFLVLLVSLALSRLYRHLWPAAEADSELYRGSRVDRERDEAGLGRRILQRLGLLRGWRAAASIRRIYRQMTTLAAAAGYPRAESATPYEYLATLGELWPEGKRESELITQAYVQVRYGEVPETKEELEEIRAAWRRLEGSQVGPPR
jgi:hypothetical protein